MGLFASVRKQKAAITPFDQDWLEAWTANSQLGDLSGPALLVPRLVRALHGDKFTGRLTLKGKSHSRFYFLDGRLVWAEAGGPDQSLGQLLLRAKMITEQQYAEAIALATSTLVDQEEVRFGECLIKLKILTPWQVYRALGHQVEAKLLSTFAWREVSWSADPDEECVSRVCMLETAPIEQLLFRGISEYAPLEDLQQALTPRVALYAKLSDSAPAVGGRLALPDRERECCRLLSSGRLTLGEALNQSDLDYTQALALVSALLLNNSVELAALPWCKKPAAEAEATRPRDIAEAAAHGEYSVCTRRPAPPKQTAGATTAAEANNTASAPAKPRLRLVTPPTRVHTQALQSPRLSQSGSAQVPDGRSVSAVGAADAPRPSAPYRIKPTAPLGRVALRPRTQPKRTRDLSDRIAKTRRTTGRSVGWVGQGNGGQGRQGRQTAKGEATGIDSHAMFRRAKRFLSYSKPKEAFSIFAKVVEVDDRLHHRLYWAWSEYLATADSSAQRVAKARARELAVESLRDKEAEGHAKAHHILGHFLRLEGEKAAARRHLRKSVELDESDLPAQRELRILSKR